MLRFLFDASTYLSDKWTGEGTTVCSCYNISDNPNKRVSADVSQSGTRLQEKHPLQSYNKNSALCLSASASHHYRAGKG